ncbi:GerW family sporulation protein [Terrisporobacter sp.]
MRATNSIQSIMETTLETIKNSIDSNTIVGSPIKSESSVIVPISKVTVGFGIGGGEYNKNCRRDTAYDTNFAGGSGGAITICPVAFVVVENGETRLISLEDNINIVDNILTVTPKIIDKIQKILKHNSDKEVEFQEDLEDIKINKKE